MTEFAVIAIFIFAAAMLYSSVGHGGASGYLAVMALFSFAPATMRPTALILNICVSSIAAFKFARKGFFSWEKFYPFAIASVPFAYIGGTLDLPAIYFKPVLGLVLIIAAVLLARRPNTENVEKFELRALSPLLALLCGAVLGLIAGLTGVGGGIFLSPLLLFMKWTDVRQTAAISAMFILVNSTAGLAANLGQTDIAVLPPWHVFATFGAAAVVGGNIGATFGSNRKHSGLTLRRLLAVVLLIAALKLIFD
jgi:hypothetical protein